MKKSPYLLRICLTIASSTVLFAMVGCGNSDSQSKDEAPEVVPETVVVTETVVIKEEATTAIEGLSYAEKPLFDAIVDYSPNLKNPSSIRIAEKKSTGVIYWVRLSGENSYGGTASSWYCYDYDFTTGRGTLTPEIIDVDSLPTGSWVVDINKINKALQEYFS